SGAFGVASQSIQTDGCVDGSSSVTEEHTVTDTVLKLPVVSLKSAEVPTAVFPAKSGGAVQLRSACEPTAVWRPPSILLCIARFTHSRIVQACRVGGQRKRTHCSVVEAVVVIDHGGGS